MPKEKIYSILLVMLAGLAIAINYAGYSNKDLLSFGYTPTFLSIADSSLEQGAYASTIEGMTNNVLHGFEYREKLAESQREPLYPAAIMAAKAMGFHVSAVVGLQLFALAVAMYLVVDICQKLYGLSTALIVWSLIAVSPVCFFYSQILYPYVLNYVFVIAALYLLIRKTVPSACLASIPMALAIYERGMFIVLPIFFVAAYLISSRSSDKHRFKVVVTFLVCTYLLLSPWLVRNYSQGVYGMNQMSGYSLGYTYGKLHRPSIQALNFTSSDDKLFEQLVSQYGTDAGSLAFIGTLMQQERVSWAEADKRLTQLVKRAIAANPREALNIVSGNLKRWPTGLSGGFALGQGKHMAESPASFYTTGRIGTSVWIDRILFVFFVFGISLQLRKRELLAALILSLVAFSALVTTTVVVFDPRYRGPVDPFIYIFATLAMKSVFFFVLENGRKIYRCGIEAFVKN